MFEIEPAPKPIPLQNGTRSFVRYSSSHNSWWSNMLLLLDEAERVHTHCRRPERIAIKHAIHVDERKVGLHIHPLIEVPYVARDCGLEQVAAGASSKLSVSESNAQLHSAPSLDKHLLLHVHPPQTIRRVADNGEVRATLGVMHPRPLEAIAQAADDHVHAVDLGRRAHMCRPHVEHSLALLHRSLDAAVGLVIVSIQDAGNLFCETAV
mmetsp:Transcript_53297/g.122482  ORF Transcript_53297/g.122482 Transcript_53297/m.122482 type:complete len:209 (-) Transcript_53297:273-899(-)